MKNYIFALESLSYIAECCCIEATGEAKVEISILIKKLLNDSDFKIENGVAIANRLTEALNCKNNREVASIISAVCRNLWKETMGKLNEHS